MEHDDNVTVEQAAAELNVKPASVYRAMKESRLPFLVIYGRKLVSRSDLEAYKKRTRPEGEKPKGRPPGAKNIQTEKKTQP